MLPELREITLDHLSRLDTLPTTTIKTDEDVEHWKTQQSYHDHRLFLRRLNESVVGHSLPYEEEHSQAVERMLLCLDTLDHWVDEIPPLESPQRFGNLAFRTWGQRLEERSEFLLDDLLGPVHRSAKQHIKPYFLTSFGSFTRMDYGTGHETSFALFLLCLTLIRFFEPVLQEERQLVLSVFLRYLRLCWKLQDVYRLEPAGSHGVWGLDDYCFLPFIFGSGQLRGNGCDFNLSAILNPPLPPSNLYFMAIMRIHQVKYGPFHEHSSQLHSIANGVPNWGKVNSGLFKMYEGLDESTILAEVLGKRVVVQHIPLGGLLEWEDESGATPPSGASRGSHTYASSMAPWNTTTRPSAATALPPLNSRRTVVSPSATFLSTGGSYVARQGHVPSNRPHLPR